MWRDFWHLANEMEVGDVELVKVKGHATDKNVADGLVSAFEKEGNSNADHFAKRCSAIAEAEYPTTLLVEHHRTAVRWYRWIAEFVQHWVGDVQDRAPVVHEVSAQPTVATLEPPFGRVVCIC